MTVVSRSTAPRSKDSLLAERMRKRDFLLAWAILSSK
jgi:hypothetical protein